MATGVATGLVGLLGWPVGHSLSPAMHEAAFTALGLDLRYLAFPVEPARLGEAITGASALGVRGLNVTVPHKEAALAHCDPDEVARRAGAVNTLVFVDPEAARDGREAHHRRPVGLNTDVHGFRMLLAELGISPAGRRVVILGAGGAARAVTLALDEDGATSIDLVARHPRQVVVGTRARTTSPWSHDALAPLLARADLLVDTTPRGLAAESASDSTTTTASAAASSSSPSSSSPSSLPPSWIDLALLPPTAAVIDLVVRPATALVVAARARGLLAATGEAMLLHQGARAFTAWTGLPAPIEVMRAALAEALRRSRAAAPSSPTSAATQQ